LNHNSLFVSEDGPASELSSRIPNTTTTRSLCAITDFEHPAPELVDVQRAIVRSTRENGVRLSAKLYLPPGHDVTRTDIFLCLDGFILLSINQLRSHARRVVRGTDLFGSHIRLCLD
jgi:hypothetical protein